MVFESISGFTGWKWSTTNLTYSIRASLLFTWAYYVHNNTQHNSTRFGKYSRYTTTRYLYTRIPANGCIEPRTHTEFFVVCLYRSVDELQCKKSSWSGAIDLSVYWNEYISMDGVNSFLFRDAINHLAMDFCSEWNLTYMIATYVACNKLLEFY